MATQGAVKAAEALRYRPRTLGDLTSLSDGEKIQAIQTVADIIDEQTGLPELLEACKACWAYWKACAESSRIVDVCTTDASGEGHAATHCALDTHELGLLANKAARLTHAAIAKAEAQ